MENNTIKESEVLHRDTYDEIKGILIKFFRDCIVNIWLFFKLYFRYFKEWILSLLLLPNVFDLLDMFSVLDFMKVPTNFFANNKFPINVGWIGITLLINLFLLVRKFIMQAEEDAKRIAEMDGKLNGVKESTEIKVEKKLEENKPIGIKVKQSEVDTLEKEINKKKTAKSNKSGTSKRPRK